MEAPDHETVGSGAAADAPRGTGTLLGHHLRGRERVRRRGRARGWGRVRGPGRARGRGWARQAMGVGLALLLAGCAPSGEAGAPPVASAEEATPTLAADRSDGDTLLAQAAPPDRGKRAVGEEAMVVSAHPLASDAGLEMLHRGGNAVDAAVAAAFAVGVVEPMMAGLGGSGGMLVWMEEAGRADYLDFYARSPADPDPAVLDLGYEDMSPMGVAVPGTVAGLLEVQERYGVLPRQALLEPAIRLAEEGFPVHSLLARLIRENREKLTLHERPSAIFYPGGEPLGAGERLVQPELGQTMRRIAEEGRVGFHEGEVAEEIVRTLASFGNPMTLDDLASFEPTWRRPVCGTYRERVVLSAPPPQSGMQIVQALNLLEPFDLPSKGLPTRSAEAADRIARALRISAADRDRFLGDPAHSVVPVLELTSIAYASARLEEMWSGALPAEQEAGDPFALGTPEPESACRPLEPFVTAGGRDGLAGRIAPASSDVPPTWAAGPGTRAVAPTLAPVSPTLPSVAPTLAPVAPTLPSVAPTLSPGDPALPPVAPALAPTPASPPGPSTDPDAHGETTHLSVVDAAGNAAALTFTQGVYFGSGAWAAGTFLNSSQHIFTGDTAHPNALGPRRAPRSTTTPTIVLEVDGRVRTVIGSPGAGRIPPAVVQNLVYLLDYGMDPMDAIRMPRLYPFLTEPVVRLEHGFAAEVIAQLRGWGYEPEVMEALELYFGGVHMIDRRDGRWIGAADLRRDGAARGY